MDEVKVQGAQVNLDADLALLGRGDLNLFDRERLGLLPGDGGYGVERKNEISSRSRQRGPSGRSAGGGPLQVMVC